MSGSWEVEGWPVGGSARAGEQVVHHGRHVVPVVSTCRLITHHVLRWCPWQHSESFCTRAGSRRRCSPRGRAARRSRRRGQQQHAFSVISLAVAGPAAAASVACPHHREASSNVADGSDGVGCNGSRCGGSAAGGRRCHPRPSAGPAATAIVIIGMAGSGKRR